MVSEFVKIILDCEFDFRFLKMDSGFVKIILDCESGFGFLKMDSGFEKIIWIVKWVVISENGFEF